MVTVTKGRTQNLPFAKKIRLSKHTDMTIHWKAPEEHFLMVPLVFWFNNIWGIHFLNFSQISSFPKELLEIKSVRTQFKSLVLVRAYSSFSRPTAIVVSKGRTCAFSWYLVGKMHCKQYISLHSNAFCPPGTSWMCMCGPKKRRWRSAVKTINRGSPHRLC
jgi:hypothetical protein